MQSPVEFVTTPIDVIEQTSIFEEILTDLSNSYVEKIDTKKLAETAYQAMLKTLDPYTAFENVGEVKSFQESVSGRYGGVGLIISGTSENANLKLPSKSLSPMTLKSKLKNTLQEPKGVRIVDAFEGYSYDFGLRVGDQIIAVDGVDTTAMGVEQVRTCCTHSRYTCFTLRADMFPSINISFGSL